MMLARARPCASAGTDVFAGGDRRGASPRRRRGPRDRFRGDVDRGARPAADSAELVVCCEVLEHLPDPHAGARRRSPRSRSPWLIVERPARAALAGAQPGAAQVRRRARQHARPPRTTGRSAASCASSESGSRCRGAQPAAVDDGALPKRGSAAMSRLRAVARLGALPVPGVSRSSASGSPGASTMHSMGWAQLGHFAQVRALADGTRTIDPWHWETNDKAWIDGHFYSVKSPGMAALSPPLYLLIDAARRARRSPTTRPATPRDADQPRWVARRGRALRPVRLRRRAGGAIEERIEDGDAGRLGADPARRGDPGGAAAVRGALGRPTGSSPATGPRPRSRWASATILMTFAAEYFSHVISAALGFAAFAVLMREREGPRAAAGCRGAPAAARRARGHLRVPGRPGRVSSSSPSRSRAAVAARAPPPTPRGRVRRGAPGARLQRLGARLAARSSPTATRSPRSAVSGHDALGLNGDGFFGITVPTPRAPASTCCSAAAGCWC